MMKKILSKLTVLFLCVCMVLSLLPMGVFADDAPVNGELNVEMTIKERNGVKVDGYFFRRGIAIEKGLLYTTDDICVKENGTIIPSTAEISEKYDDGSIRWLLVSAKVDLKPNEYKRLQVTNGSYKGSTTTYSHSNDKMYVDSEKIDLVFGAGGIESLKYNGAEQLNGTPINMYVTIGGETHYLTVSKIEVMKHNKLYSKFKLKGGFTSGVTGELVITLPEKGSRIQIDHRFTVAVENPDIITFSSIGLTVGGKYADSAVGRIVNSDWLELGNMQLSSYENTRFENVGNFAEKTGYVIGENAVHFAPIVNEKDYGFSDGMSRTVHLYIGFSDSAEDYAKTLALPPNIVVDAEQYVKAGGLMTNAEMNPWLKKAVDTYAWGYQQLVARITVGSICVSIDPKAKTMGTNWADSPGELEYDLGLAWMISGNEEIYRQVYDMAESRSDIAVYRGLQESGHGAMRTQFPSAGSSGSGNYSSSTHGYYGDEGGLYMATVLTGEEYFAETFKLCIENTLFDMYDIPALGGHTIQNMVFAQSISGGEFQESRGLIRPRTMYLASNYFQDSRYKKAMQDILEWAKKTQRPDGSIPQATYNNGTVLHQQAGMMAQAPVKDYILLYGFRGISQILDWEDNELALDMTLRVADHLCDQGEKFGPLFYQPNGDINVFAVNEDGTRGTSPRDNLLAIDVLCTAYEHSGNERYLKWILAFMQNFMATEIGGMGAHSITIKDWPGQGNGVGNDAWRCHTIFRCMDSITNIFEENKEKIAEMGYEDLLVIFSEGAVAGKDANHVNQKYPFVTHNIYENGTDRALFVSNNTMDTDDPNDVWDRDVEVTFNENQLWQGVDNVVENTYKVVLKKFLMNTEFYTAMQRPVFVDEIAGKATISIDEYTEEKLSLTIGGDFEIGLRVENGKFAVEDNTGYNVEVKKTDGKVKITITRGGQLYPENGVIKFNLNSRGKLIDIVGTDVLNKTGLAACSIDDKLSGETLRCLVKDITSEDITLSTNPSWGEFATELIGALSSSGSDMFETVGLSSVFEGIENTTISDEEAVRTAAEALSVDYIGDALASDVFLTPKSLHNTTVTWQSEREDILTNDGIIDRDKIDCDSIKMTATVTRGNAKYERVFDIPLATLIPKTVESGSMFLDKNYAPLKKQTGKFEITFDVTPKQEMMDAIVILGSSDHRVTELANSSYMIRFNKTGTIDSMNVDWYYAENILEYKKDVKYHCRMVVDLDAQLCDVYVTPEGEAEVLIAKNYVPRMTAPKLDMIDTLWAWRNDKHVPYILENISLISFEKEKQAEIGTYDSAGQYFGPYDLRKNYVLPYMTEENVFYNWVRVDSKVKKYGQNVTTHLGIESLKSEKLSVIELMKQARLLPENVTEDSYVTVGSIKNILLLTTK